MVEQEKIVDERALEERLSRPTADVIEAVAKVDGRLLILGAGGKIGPSVARMAQRAVEASGSGARVTAVSRFRSGRIREALDRCGVETVSCDLTRQGAVDALPDAGAVLSLVGVKFGHLSAAEYERTNVEVHAQIAARYPESRLVVMGTGNVYPFTHLGRAAPTETASLAPRGAYAETCRRREMALEEASANHGTKICILRLNYAVDLRYGVVVDIGERLLAGEAISLRVPEVNFVWQGYANCVTLRAFALAECPGTALNVTGTGRWRVREVAERLSDQMDVAVRFADDEGEESLLSDASQCHRHFGCPEVDDDEVIRWVAEWLKSGGRTLGKPTGFQVTDGKY